MKLMQWAVCVVILCKLAFALDQIEEYQLYIARLEWSVDTLKLNVDARRDMMRACQRYNGRFLWCRTLRTPQWIPAGQREGDFRG